MTRRELIKAVQGALREDAEVKVELTQHDIAAVIDATFEQIAKAMRAQGRYAHPGFGSFAVKHNPARPGMNPRTGERIEVAASASIRFSPSRSLLDRL